MAIQGIRNQFSHLVMGAVYLLMALSLMTVAPRAFAGSTGGVQVDKEATYSTVRRDQRNAKKSDSSEKKAKREVAGTDTADAARKTRMQQRQQIAIEHRGLRGDVR